MKKIVAIALIIFAIILTSLLTANFVYYQKNKDSQQTSSTTPMNQNSEVTNQIAQSNSTGLTLNSTGIAKHNTVSDCWLLIGGKVYNVTNYISSHPGGVAEIGNNCGTDATAAFQTKGGRGNSHSQSANNMLAAYYIGDLNQNITQKQLNTNVQQTNTMPPPPITNRDDDYDD
jgi:cytochrome b involved in lipid metabolism